MKEHGDPVEAGPARVRVTRGLLAEVFSGRLISGQRLVEMELAERFSVSRTPVRESLAELTALGLVAIKPNCGAVLRAFGPIQIREIYQVRAVLEAEATRLACGRWSDAALAALLDEFLDLLGADSGRAWVKRVWNADVRFHEGIASHCGNTRLAEEIRRYGNFVQVIRETVGNRDRAQEIALREHLEILDPLRSGDAEASASAMRRHITLAGEAAVQAMDPAFRRARRSNVEVA